MLATAPMNQPHTLGVSGSSIEAVDPKFLKEGLFQAREKTITALEIIRSQLKEGLTEDDARKLALRVFQEMGVTKHWHKPHIRFGAGTALTFHEPPQQDYKLKSGDPYYIDLGPVWRDSELGLEYEGDYGDTFVLGVNTEAERCAAAARQIFEEAKEKWRSSKLTGPQLYEFLAQRSKELVYSLLENVDGHRLSDFPHQKYSKERLARVPFTPSEATWVLEVQINDPQMRFYCSSGPTFNEKDKYAV